jgi:hypothetical protein
MLAVEQYGSLYASRYRALRLASLVDACQPVMFAANRRCYFTCCPLRNHFVMLLFAHANTSILNAVVRL